MANRRTVAILLVATGIVVVLALLALAIYGEISRPKNSERIAKLILVSAWDTRTPDEQSAIINDAYDAFLKLKPDVELAYTVGGLTRLVALEALLDLKSGDQEAIPTEGAQSLASEQAMYDMLYGWFSPEDTELDKNAETVSKQFNFLSVNSSEISHILRRIGNPTSKADLLAIEALPPSEIRILITEPDQNTFHHYRDSASFDILRRDLCPNSVSTDDSQCLWHQEATYDDIHK